VWFLLLSLMWFFCALLLGRGLGGMAGYRGVEVGEGGQRNGWLSRSRSWGGWAAADCWRQAMDYIGFTHERWQRRDCRIAMEAREWIEEEEEEEWRRSVRARGGGFILLAICKSMDSDCK